MQSNWKYYRGDIYIANLYPFFGSEEGGLRPVVVVQNNCGNKHSSTLIVASISSKDYSTNKLPTHYYAYKNKFLKSKSTVQLEQLRTIDKKRIVSYIGKFTKEEMMYIDQALLVSLGLKR